MNLKLPPTLSKIATNFRVVRDRMGMSPAKVYRLTNGHDTLFLKISDSRYDGTTYDVQREMNTMLWLKGKLPVPEVIHFEEHEGRKYLLMSAAHGILLSQENEIFKNPNRAIQYFAQGIHLLQSIDVSKCPYDNCVKNRLAELHFLMSHDLADVDVTHWESDTPFQDPDALFRFLNENVPPEEFVLSHGDFGDSNLFVENGRVSGIIDLGRTGKADKWCDIAFCVRALRTDFGADEKLINVFFQEIDIPPNWDRMKYYILLDELF